VIEVLRPGPLATVQDAGRHGHAHLGVGHAGAVDADAYALANRLAGNPYGAAAIELTLGGAALRFRRPARFALTGAPAPAALDGRPAAYGRPEYAPRGAVLTLGAPDLGVRTYLAVGGGIDVPPTLGSRSTDTLSGLGPPVLAAGDLLPVGPAARSAAAADWTPPRLPAALATVRATPGPRAAWLTDAAAARLYAHPWEVTADANRVGVRLRGPALDRTVTGELPSEGMVAGAVQLPASGQPIVFLADHPTTGGYPVVAVVAEPDLPLVAQARPGQRLRFAAVPHPFPVPTELRPA
jgi:biotin-dependent carboxylase-like uncharacterized protein